MSTPESQAAVRALLEGLSDLEIRELCVKALRLWHAKAPGEFQLSMHGALGRELVPLLAKRKDVPEGDVNSLKEPFHDAMDQPWMTGIVEFVSWLLRAGLAIPLTANTNSPVSLRLLRAGVRLLEIDDDHPLLPGFLDRVRGRCPGLPDEVTALLADASACLDHGLMRPAIVLMGVAYEVAVEAVVETLVARNVLDAAVAEKKAAARISAVKAKIDTVLPSSTVQERDDRFAAHAAYDFADALRRRRNDASHTAPTYGFDDRAETEEFLVSAGRHLPSLWSVR